MTWRPTKRQRILLWIAVAGMLLAALLRAMNGSGNPIYPALWAIAFALLALARPREPDERA
jgi:hypothetical protein